jgi:hypothetical protein
VLRLYVYPYSEALARIRSHVDSLWLALLALSTQSFQWRVCAHVRRVVFQVLAVAAATRLVLVQMEQAHILPYGHPAQRTPILARAIPVPSRFPTLTPIPILIL